jgi:hypothetical protein
VSPSTKEPLARRALRQRIAKQGRPPTLLEVAVMAVGVRRGAEVLWSLLMWTMARRKKGGERPTAEELAAMEFVSVGAGFKHQALLREVWGGDEGIAAMADVLEESCGSAIGELLAVGEGGDRATAMVLVASLPAVGFAV